MRIPSKAGLALVAALAGAAACSNAPARTAATPAVSSIVVRNASNFEVKVYAVPRSDAEPLWLATVPAKATWQIPITARGLQRDGTLIVRTQAIGSTRSWTSAAVSIDDFNYGLLDLAVSSTGDCSMSALRTVNANEMAPWM